MMDDKSTENRQSEEIKPMYICDISRECCYNNIKCNVMIITADRKMICGTCI